MVMMMIYTLPASPPKAAMLSCTHCKAADWSQSPALPGASSIPSVRKPDGPTLPLRNWSILCSPTILSLHTEDDVHTYSWPSPLWYCGSSRSQAHTFTKNKASLFIVDKHLFTVAFTRVHHLLEKPLLSAKPRSNILYWKWSSVRNLWYFSI